MHWTQPSTLTDRVKYRGKFFRYVVRYDVQRKIFSRKRTGEWTWVLSTIISYAGLSFLSFFFFFFFLNVASSLKRTTQKSINKRAFSRFPPLTYSRITHGYLRRFPSFRIHEIAGQQNHIFTCMHIFLISGASAQRLLACENWIYTWKGRNHHGRWRFQEAAIIKTGEKAVNARRYSELRAISINSRQTVVNTPLSLLPLSHFAIFPKTTGSIFMRVYPYSFFRLSFFSILFFFFIFFSFLFFFFFCRNCKAE